MKIDPKHIISISNVLGEFFSFLSLPNFFSIFKIFNNKYCLVISGDTTYSERVIEKSNNCDVLIHEIAHASEHTLEKYPKAKGRNNLNKNLDFIYFFYLIKNL